MRRYFKLQILNGTTKTNHVDEVLADNRVTSHIDYAGKAFLNLNAGDLFLIHKGSNPTCLAEVLYKITDPAEINGTDFGINYKVKVLGFYNELDDSLRFKTENKKVGHNGTFQELTNPTSQTLRFLKQWFNHITTQKKMTDYIDLLKYKKQIILQGPPGTGKTKLAIELAEKLTGGNIPISPYEEIEKFFKDYEVNEKVREHRKLVNSLNTSFLEKFPKENLKNLGLEDYALGTENQDNFCYWLEYKLIHTGKYTGRATKGKIYWDSNSEEYNKSGFIKDIEDDDEAMGKIADLLDKIVSEKYDHYPIGRGFVLKVLNTYYPEKYFPINSESCLNNFLKLVKKDYGGLNYIDKNKLAQQIFTDLNSKYGNKATNYEFMYFLFRNFDLKGEIVLEDDKLVSIGEFKLIQFHPSFSYEDFVRGIVAKPNKQGTGILYEAENKVLANFAGKASSNPAANYVLIVDEINRANLSSVLGELIYGLEYRGESVESMYAVSGDNELILPPNLYIIGTMNTADRSVGHIDYAIRRRFAFVDVLPENLAKDGLAEFDEPLFRKISELFIANYDGYYNLQELSQRAKTLSTEFRVEDVWLGHSYFINKDNGGDIKTRLDYEIKPILMEYVKDGILIGKVGDIAIENYIKSL